MKNSNQTFCKDHKILCRLYQCSAGRSSNTLRERLFTAPRPGRRAGAPRGAECRSAEGAEGRGRGARGASGGCAVRRRGLCDFNRGRRCLITFQPYAITFKKWQHSRSYVNFNILQDHYHSFKQIVAVCN